ncbi:hypothetical protein BGX20_005150 [Mortierella sp. AD010]|nr:hypothetical protein BGX20_005150 [Mortierella sp. AD010]
MSNNGGVPEDLEKPRKDKTTSSSSSIIRTPQPDNHVQPVVGVQTGDTLELNTFWGVCINTAMAILKITSRPSNGTKCPLDRDALNSQYSLGNIFYYGYGVNKNYHVAFEWYLESTIQDMCLLKAALETYSLTVMAFPKTTLKL